MSEPSSCRCLGEGWFLLWYHEEKAFELAVCNKCLPSCTADNKAAFDDAYAAAVVAAEGYGLKIHQGRVVDGMELAMERMFRQLLREGSSEFVLLVRSPAASKCVEDCLQRGALLHEAVETLMTFPIKASLYENGKHVGSEIRLLGLDEARTEPEIPLNLKPLKTEELVEALTQYAQSFLLPMIRQDRSGNRWMSRAAMCILTEFMNHLLEQHGLEGKLKSEELDPYHGRPWPNA